MLYFIFSLVGVSFDVRDWEAEGRYVFGVVAALGLVIMLVFYSSDY